MIRLARALAWLPAFYLLWGGACVVWTAMLVRGRLRGEPVVLHDCFQRHIARRVVLPAAIRPGAIRRVVSLVEGLAQRLPGAVSEMDAWRILGLCSLSWLLQSSWRLPAFHLLVLASPVLAAALALHASVSFRRLHPWYGRPRNVLVFGYTLHRRGLTPREFLELRFHEDARRARADDHATGLMWLFDVCAPTALGQDVSHLQDKVRFDAWARSHGAAVAPLLARFRDGAVGPMQPQLPARDLFSKQNRSSWGSGAELWRFRDGRYEAGGARYTAGELVDALCHRTRLERGPAVGVPDEPVELLLHERVPVHPRLQGLSSALPSCRIVTLKGLGRPSRPALAMLRASSDPEAVVDNFNARHPGGFVCAVDLRTGVVGPGYAGTAPLERLHANPRTGFAFAGLELPFWEETLALCCRLHDASGVPPEIGWDVAFTPSGPLLVEANVTSDHAPIQAVNAIPHARALYADCLASWLRAA